MINFFNKEIMKYFCVLLLIIVTACSKSNDKQLDNISPNAIENKKSTIIEPAELKYVKSVIYNNTITNEILLQYMRNFVYEGTNDLMSEETIAKLDSKSKKFYAAFLSELLIDFCLNFNSGEQKQKLIREAYDYLNETKLFDEINITNQIHLVGEFAHAVTYYHNENNPSGLAMCYEIMNNLSNKFKQTGFHHVLYYFRYGDIYSKMQDYEKAKECYVNMSKYADSPRIYQLAMKYYYTRGLNQYTDIEEYKNSVVEFLEIARPEYDSYYEALNELVEAIIFDSNHDIYREIDNEMRRKKITLEDKQYNYRAKRRAEYRQKIRKEILEEVNNLRKGKQS